MLRISKSPKERKDEIIQTALELFSKKGYEHTTIQDIAEKMGISQGLCYRYFKSKQAIYEATAAYYAEKCMGDLDTLVTFDLPAVEKLNAVIFQLFVHASSHNEFESSNRRPSEIQIPKVVEVAEKIISIVIPIIQQGVEEKTFFCDEIEKVARFFSYGLCFMLHPSKMPPDNPKEYILSHRTMVKTLCIQMFGIDKNIGIGSGWDYIKI